MHAGERWRLRHRPGLDGLRGVAIGLVLLAHTFRDQFPTSGSVGVTVFFALSGFLITSLLLEDRSVEGRPSFRRFYERRARRLLPALVVYLAFWVALAALGVGMFDLNAVETIGSLLYVSNWLMAANLPIHDPIGITWSLAVEEQFYMLWPLVFLAVRRHPWAPAVVAFGGVIVAVMMRVILWDGGVWAIYYRTDTRMDSILIGCLLALAVHRFGTGWLRLRALSGVGVAALVALIAFHGDVVKYGLTPFVGAVAGCALIGSVLCGRSRWLEQPALRWLGRRSYALYLWHYPLVSMAWAGMLPMWGSVAIAFTAAEASWWLVERPFRKRRSTPATPVLRVATSAA